MAEGGSKSAEYRGFFTQAGVDAAIASLAARQHAVIGLDQLGALGLSDRAVQERAANGRLHRIFQRVYSLVPKSLLTLKGHYMAAVLACGPGALLSHRSAAQLRGLRPAGYWKTEVTVPGRNRRWHRNVVLHRSVTLAPADAVVVDGIPCTSVARTLFDLAEVVDQRQVERAFDQAEAERVLNLRAVHDQLARNATRRGAKVVRAVLAEHYIGSTLTESELEEAMLRLSRAVGLPRPEVNKWLDLGDGEPMVRADFFWPAQRLVVEVDGRKYHGTRQRFESDRRRDQRMMVAGLRCIRTTEKQIKYRPRQLETTVLALLRASKLGL
jgi:hypothetical protein